MQKKTQPHADSAILLQAAILSNVRKLSSVSRELVELLSTKHKGSRVTFSVSVSRLRI